MSLLNFLWSHFLFLLVLHSLLLKYLKNKYQLSQCLKLFLLNSQGSIEFAEFLVIPFFILTGIIALSVVVVVVIGTVISKSRTGTNKNVKCLLIALKGHPFLCCYGHMWAIMSVLIRWVMVFCVTPLYFVMCSIVFRITDSLISYPRNCFRGRVTWKKNQELILLSQVGWS